jgi:Alpha/beta hydrolase domain
VTPLRFERLAGQPAVAPRGAGALEPVTMDQADYRTVEYLARGVATTYDGLPTEPATATGVNMAFSTRIVARFPTEAGRFTGRVFVEPFNTSRNGVDADVVWEQLGPLLRSNGDGWVGITVRASAAEGLRRFDSERYGAVDLETNDLEWDVLRQVGMALKEGESQLVPPGCSVRVLYMAGYSQSGVDTATYCMAIHPLSLLANGMPVFDGYFPNAHSGSIAPLQSGDSELPALVSAAMTAVAVPVLDVETQTDVEGLTVDLGGGVVYESVGGAHVRRADGDDPGDCFRLYEIAGAPHVGEDPECPSSSSFPTDAFLRAAAVRLIRWVEDDVAPPSCHRIELEVAGEISVPAVDEFGNAVGGLRSPFIDLPLSTYKVHADSGGLFMLTGDEIPLSHDVVVQKYQTLESYLQQFNDALDATIEAGDLLSIDRDELLASQEVKARVAFRSGSS